jgi:hypothetical protein
MVRTPETRRSGFRVIAGSPFNGSNAATSGQDSINTDPGSVLGWISSPTSCSTPANAATRRVP